MTEKMEKAIERILDEMCDLEKKKPWDEKDVKVMGELADMLSDIAQSKGMIEYSDGMFDDGNSQGMSYRNNGMSMRRGRSSVTGRFVSRDSMPYDNHSYTDRTYTGGGNSGHSIHDRITAMLEGMYDSAGTEYDRQVIHDAIERERNVR
jgi:hypothetical protein